MNQYLESLANNYVVVYVISLLDGSFRRIKSISVVDALTSQFQDAQSLMNAVVENSIYQEFQDEMRRFLDLSTLQERLSGNKSISSEYIGKQIGWCSAQFLPVTYHENGTCTEVIFAVSHIQKVKLVSEIYRQALEKNATFVFQFDLTEGIIGLEFEPTVRNFVPDFPYSFPMTHDDFIHRYFDYVAGEPYKDGRICCTAQEMQEFYQNGISRFETKYYSRRFDAYYQHEFFLSKDESSGHIIAMVVGTDISKEVAAERRNAAQAVEILSREFQNMFWVNLNTDEAILLKTNGYFTRNMKFVPGMTIPYRDAISKYASICVPESDRERFLCETELEVIREKLATHSTFSIVYQVYAEDGTEHTNRVKISRMEETDQGDIVLLGFQNIDAFMAEERRKTQILRTLSSKYANVYLVHPQRNTCYIVKQSTFIPNGYKASSSKALVYSDIVDAYVSQRVCPEDQERVRAAFQPEQVIQELSAKQSFGMAYRVVGEDGLHDYQATMIRAKEEEEEAYFVLGFQNIDGYLEEQHKQKLALQESLRNKEMAIEEMRKSRIYIEAVSASYEYVIVYNITKNTYDTIVNHNFLNLGAPKQGVYTELLTFILSYFYEENLPRQKEVRTLQGQMERYRSGKRFFEDRHRAYDKNGKLHWVRERTIYMKDSGTGDILGISISALIDEEVEKENKINQITHALVRDYLNVYLIKPQTDEMLAISLNGYLMPKMNQHVGVMISYQKMIHAYLNERVVPEDRERLYNAISVEHIEETMQGKEEMTIAYHILQDGREHCFQVKVIRTPEEGTYIFGFKNIDDLMEEERRRQKKYQEMLAETERANRAKTDFLSRMSHDIRTPINGIVGMSHIMKTQIGDEKKMAEGLAQIDQLSHHLELMINDVLEMSRIESGKIELAHKAFDLPDLMTSFAPAILAMASGKEIFVKTTVGDVLHKTVISSPAHIQRIVMNVLSNAIKYTPERGHVSCHMREIVIDDTHSNYEFTVTDSGIGMSEDFVKHIFEPFAREQKTVNTTYKGTGLGMSITKEFVDLLGGSIEISSQKGVGTTVRFTLPLEIAGEVTPVSEPNPSISLEGKRILLVEDNKMNMKFARFLLEEENALVDTAMNGQEAVDRFQNSIEGYYDLILMDVMMPVMDGLEATKIIRSLDRADAGTVPILAMSANAFQEDVEQCIAAGMNDHIAKPLDIELAKAKISRYA